jgi:hypothetical protein
MIIALANTASSSKRRYLRENSNGCSFILHYIF